MFSALIDTGAQKTMISANVVSTVGLVPIGKIAVQGVGPSVAYHNAYAFHVAFIVAFTVPGQMVTPGAAVSTAVHFNLTPIHGAEIPSTLGFDVLLGMDVLATGSLKIEGNGTFSFSF